MIEFPAGVAPVSSGSEEIDRLNSSKNERKIIKIAITEKDRVFRASRIMFTNCTSEANVVA